MSWNWAWFSLSFLLCDQLRYQEAACCTHCCAFLPGWAVSLNSSQNNLFSHLLLCLSSVYNCLQLCVVGRGCVMLHLWGSEGQTVRISSLLPCGFKLRSLGTAVGGFTGLAP